jgi:branched-chain amino acid aminotransferase
MEFHPDSYKISKAIKTWLNEIREGKREDKFGWMVKV